MKSRLSKSLPEPVRRRVDMAVAVAQERLLSTHVLHALDLIEVVGDRVPFDDALDIYTRLLRLSSEEAGVITTRALATLGERADEESWPSKKEPQKSEAERGGRQRSFFSQLRDRLRGRINDDLRFLIELEAARTEEALLYTHVENALNFVDLLEQELSYPDAVELYLDALEVRESVGEVVYYLTLSRLSEKHLPEDHRERKTRPEPELAREATGEPGGAHPLRVVEGDGGEADD